MSVTIANIVSYFNPAEGLPEEFARASAKNCPSATFTTAKFPRRAIGTGG